MSLLKIEKIINAGKNREMYFENPIQDNYKHSLKSVRLIHGIKNGKYIRQLPGNYGLPGTIGYCLLRGYNCLAKCEYCYLQSYLKSPDIIVFENKDDFIENLKQLIDNFIEKYGKNQKLVFYDGDFYDSFGYVNTKFNIEFINQIIQLIQKYDNVYLDLRSKCISDFKLFKKLIISNKVVYGISFSPQIVIEKYEKGTSSIEERIEFGTYLSDLGATIGVRFDPIIFIKNIDNTIDVYKQLIDKIKTTIKGKKQWSFGCLRLKKQLYKYLNYIGSRLVNELIWEDGFYKYPLNYRKKIYNELSGFIDTDNFYFCMDQVNEIN